MCVGYRVDLPEEKKQIGNGLGNIIFGYKARIIQIYFVLSS